jgi:hypothetical protein
MCIIVHTPFLLIRLHFFLSRLRRANPDLFASVPLFLAVCELMAAYEYPLSARRLIHALFEKVPVNDLQVRRLRVCVPCALRCVGECGRAWARAVVRATAVHMPTFTFAWGWVGGLIE